jgi:soluble P-type ATPase
MITINIPGRSPLQLEHLVCDVNGTLAFDGHLIPGVRKRLKRLRRKIAVHLVTADTHGKQGILDDQLGLQAIRIHSGNEAAQKSGYVRRLGPRSVVAIGQGANDVSLLKAAGLGICVLSSEGTCTRAVLAADILTGNILAALDLLENPKRISATLRK